MSASELHSALMGAGMTTEQADNVVKAIEAWLNEREQVVPADPPVKKKKAKKKSKKRK